MRVRFFGTRGSLPVPGPRTVRYGGNTACVEVRAGDDTLVVLDMGTGAYALGQELMRAGRPVKGHVLISHTHWDHIQGLPFFAPFFAPGNEWDIYAPRGLNASLRETLSGQMQYTYFPVTLEQLGATIRYHDLVEGHLRVGGVEVDAHYLNHPALTLGYRLTADGVALVYACDHEPYVPALARGEGAVEGQDRAHVAFLEGADLVVHDAQYTGAEYATKVGWGHSSIEYARLVARAAGARRLAITHHDPTRDDDALDALIAGLDGAGEGSPEVFAAAEGLVIDLVARGEATAAAATGAATVTPALVDQSVLIAAPDRDRAEALAGVLRQDAIAVSVVAPSDLVAAAARGRPSLVLIQDGVDAGEGGGAGGDRDERDGALLRTTRALREVEPDLSIILVAAGPPGADGGDERLGISDRLVEPYTANYARTRVRAWLMRTACHWARAPRPENEVARLAALRQLRLLDTAPEPRFDHLTRLAARALAVPIAAMTLIDSDRQWFKSSCGLGGRELPRDESFCAHVVYDPSAALVVPDTLRDTRFAGSPIVTGPPHLRAYAGHPLVLADGTCVGTLCVADTRPRAFDAGEMEQLRLVAEMMMREIAGGAGPASPTPPGAAGEPVR